MSHRFTAAAAAALAAAAIATVPALADTGHDMGSQEQGSMNHATTHKAPKGMSVRISVAKDPMKGYNLQVRTRAFRWAPQHASQRHRSSEGHAHLYVDGEKITRLYGAWYYLGDLKPGKRVVKVTLNGNDHGDYMKSGKPVAASTTVTVPQS